MNNLVSVNMKMVQKLYTKENIFKLSLKIIIPSIFLSLLFGIYIFVDQIMLVKLVPNDGNNYIENFFNSEGNIHIYRKMLEYVEKFNQYAEYKKIASIKNEDFIVYAASQVGIFSLIVMSFGYLISAGAAILFSKAIAKNDIRYKNRIVSTSIYVSICFSIIIGLIMVAMQNVILTITMPNVSTLTENDIVSNNGILTFEEAKEYFSTYYKGVVEQTSNYVYFINSTIVFVALTNLFNYFLRAEGKVIAISLIGLFSNCLNILLDFIFIYFAKLGLLGGGLATFIGQFTNLLGVLIYLIVLNKKCKTNIDFSSLKKIYIDLVLVLNFIFIGISSFLREFSLAIANVVYLPIFVNTIGQIDQSALQSFTTMIISPLYNVFFFAIFGIIDGLRPILSFNYAANKYERVRKSYFIGTIISLVYSLISIAIMLILVTNKNVATFLNASTESDRKNLLILTLSMALQLPFMSLIVGGLALFQATNRKVMNIISSLIQGVILFYPTLFICSNIALSLKDTTLMVFTGFINISISSIIIFSISLIYIFKVFDPRRISSNEIFIYKRK